MSSYILHKYNNNTVPYLYIMIFGIVTPSQKENRNRCIINVGAYKALLSWHIDNHTYYSDILYQKDCPQPILIGEFDNNFNDINKSTYAYKKMRMYLFMCT